MAWYSNPWIVGIIGSVPSGFLVNWITGLVLGKKENREYLQKVLGANREVVYAIRPGISEGQIPSSEVIYALLNATARRYGVEASDLYTPAQIGEELTKEVMDSSFISSPQKTEYCSKLATLGVALQRHTVDSGAQMSTRTVAAEYRDRLVSSTSTLVGVLTAAMTIAFTGVEFIRARTNNILLDDFNEKRIGVFLPVVAAVSTMSVSVAVLAIFRESALKRKSSEINIDIEKTLNSTVRIGNRDRILRKRREAASAPPSDD